MFSDKISRASEELHGKQAAYPNATLDNMHAEFSFFHKAIQDKQIAKGDTLELVVAGKKKVCYDCQAHLSILAEQSGLRFMTVVDKNANLVYSWRPGMAKLKPLGEIVSSKR